MAGTTVASISPLTAFIIKTSSLWVTGATLTALPTDNVRDNPITLAVTFIPKRLLAL